MRRGQFVYTSGKISEWGQELDPASEARSNFLRLCSFPIDVILVKRIWAIVRGYVSGSLVGFPIVSQASEKFFCPFHFDIISLEELGDMALPPLRY